MNRIGTSIKDKLLSLDPIVFFTSLAISFMSVLTLFGAKDHVGIKVVLVQLFSVILGIVFVMLISAMNYEETVERLTLVFFIISVVGLAATLALGTAAGTNKSWIRIPHFPIGIQTSEFVKLFFILSFSRHLDLVREKINRLSSVLLLAVHAGTIVGLILLQGDLGTALVYLFVIAIMLFTAGLSVWYFVGVLTAVAILSPVLWTHLAEYQKQRILVGFNPELDPLDKGYQALMSRSAIANGGMFGQGLFGGTVYKSVPYVYTDFLFCITCEKFGIFGALIFFTLMITLVVRILVIGTRARKRYGSYICIGIVSVLIAQTFENVGMCLAMLPVVGITLPLMSYGGSSVFSIYLMIGVVQSIASSTNVKKF